MWWMNFAEQTPPSPPSQTPGRLPGRSGQQTGARAGRPEDAAQPRTPQGAGAESPEEEHAEEEVSRTLVAMAPWTVSLLLHAALVMLAIWIVYSEIIREEAPRETRPIPHLSPDPGTPEVTKRPKEEQETARRPTLTPDEVQTVTRINSPKPTQQTTFAVVGGAQAAANPFDGEVGEADFSGAEEFFGTPTGAEHIVFMVDASGSLTDTLPFVINEINRTVREFRHDEELEHTFSIIFFQTAADRGFVQVPWPDAEHRAATSRRMLPATEAHKTFVRQWMAPEAHNVIPQGQQDPRSTLLPALQHALTMRPRPELIILLSDNILGQGQYEVNREALVRSVLDLAQDRVKINTYQFLREEHLSGTPALRTIAERTGGVFTFVAPADLDIAGH